jgi:vanillate O-demethylase monooxygenase subunit
MPAVIAAAQNASQRMADRHTPFVVNDWYVAVFGEEIKDQLLALTLLGRRLVFFRTSASQVVALEDRCPHRSMPLSVGTLTQDTIVCGYHGLRFNTEGDCIKVPSQVQCPKTWASRPTEPTSVVRWSGSGWVRLDKQICPSCRHKSGWKAPSGNAHKAI